MKIVKSILCSFYITAFSCFFTVYTYAQPGISGFILRLKPIYTAEVLTSTSATDTIYLHTPFATPIFSNPQEAAKLQNRVIEKIELVYTTFREVDTFNQRELNYQRLLSLQKAAPELFNNITIEWKLVAQTGCRSSEEGKKTFHGFIIYLRPEQNEATLTAEILFMDSIAKDVSKIVVEDSILYFTKSKWNSRVGYVPDTASAVYFSKKHMPLFDINDKTLTNILGRNQWKHMLMVVDVTGSMYVYSAQLAIWHKTTFKKGCISHLVFFNDGDQKGNSRKIPGSTGGIYHLDATLTDEISPSLSNAMRNGSGGDIPENDVEAILAGITSCESCEHVVLVADNLANMRDEMLMNQITKPVKIILCNLRGGINPQYLDLARATKGSIHTADEDIKDLHLLAEGATITLRGFSYKLVNGKFVPQFNAE